MNATLKPNVLRWARERASLSQIDLAEKVGVNLDAVRKWETTGSIPFPAVEKLADKTYTPFGFLFLEEPPVEKLPISDFRRTHQTDASIPPSPDLLEVIQSAQLRQDWYRDHLISIGEKPLPFVGKASLNTPTKETAADIRLTLRIGSALAAIRESREDALRDTIEAIEDAGILVMRTGYAGDYTHRKLSVAEFRGFALADDYAPLVFINGADAPNAQMFTLAHEVAHVWIRQSGISNLHKTYSMGNDVELYCNKVAAEVLLPLDELRISWRNDYGVNEETERLSRQFKVSRLVVARRAFDAGLLTKGKFDSIFKLEIARGKTASGGNWYVNGQYRNSKRFSVALIIAAREGRTLYHDAMQLLGIKKDATFRNYAQRLQVEW